MEQGIPHTDGVPTHQSVARRACRWLLFTTFVNTVPTFFHFILIIGFVPTMGLVGVGVASLFLGDREGFLMGAWLTVPGLIYCALYYGAAFMLSKLIFRIHQKAWRTGVLVAIVVALLGMTLAPVYTIAGHGGSELINIIQLWQGMKLPTGGLIAYSIVLLTFLAACLVVQHSPNALSKFWAEHERWWVATRRATGVAAVLGLLLTISLIVYSNRGWMICQPLAEAGNARAQVCMARAMTAKLGKVQSDVSAVTWYERAAAQGNMTAVRELVETTRSRAIKRKWLPVLAETGEGDAQFELFELLRRYGQTEAEKKKAFSWLTQAAENDDPQAQFELGWYYAYGRERGGMYRYGVPKDLAKAREWWERAAEQGHAPAMKELAWRYEQGVEGFPLDTARAIELLDELAEMAEERQGGSEREARLAAGYRQKASAVLALQREAERGDVWAQVTLGRKILESRNPGKHGKQAGIAWLEKAAEQGDAEIQHELGAMYLFRRRGVEQDVERGRKWWDLAVAQNHIPTLEFVAEAHLTGRFGYPINFSKAKAQIQVLVAAYEQGRDGIEPDPGKARHWQAKLKRLNKQIADLGPHYRPMEQLRPEAERGAPDAQYQLGRQLNESYSKEARREAVDWWKKAAANGHHEAQFRLAKYHERGSTFVQKDHRRTVELLQQAAEGKHPKAMLDLALAYEKGRYGLSRDLRAAKALYEELVNAGETNRYGWNVDERFLDMPRRRLRYVSQVLDAEGGAG